MQKNTLDKPIFLFGIMLISINTALSVDSSLPVLPTIADSLQASSQTAPLIIGFFLLGLTLGQIPSGICADRYGRLPVLFTGLTIFIVAGLIASFTDNINIMLIARGVQGFGASMGPILSRTIARDISEGNRTVTLVSLMTAALAVTTIISPILGSFLSQIGGWRLTLFVPTVFGLCIVVYTFFFLSETRPEAFTKVTIKDQITSSFKSFIKQRQCLVAALLIGLNFGTYFALISLSSSILSDVYQFDVQEIGFLFSLVVTPYIIVSLIAGKITKHLAKNRLLEIALFLQLLVSLAMLAMFYYGGVIPLTIFWSVCAVFMACMGIIFPATVTMAMAPLAKSAGMASSIIGTFQIGMGTVFVAITSIYYDYTINSIALCIGITGIISFIIYMKNRHLLG